MVGKGSPQYFKFDELRCDANKFKSQMHRNDPAPFSPRWLSGYEIMQQKRTKKYVSSPTTTQLKSPTKRSYANRSTSNSQVHLDHKIHRRSRPKTAPNHHVYRIWDSSKRIDYRSNKRQFSKTTKSGDCSVAYRFGKRQIKKSKPIYPDTLRFGALRLFPKRKEASYNKPNSTRVAKTKRLIPQKCEMKGYMAPTNTPKIPNLSAFPREKTTDVWLAHTPLNSTNVRPKTSSSQSQYRNRTLISSIMCHS